MSAPKTHVYITPEGTLTYRLHRSRIFDPRPTGVCRNSLSARLEVAAEPGARLQLVQKIDHRGVDLRRPFLLGPVTATREHDLAAQLRHVVCQIGDNLIHAVERYHQVTIASHIKRRHYHLRASERR